MILLATAGCGGGGGGSAGSDPPPVPNPAQPDIVSVAPADHATGVPVGCAIQVAFRKDMDPATITLSTIRIRAGGIPVTGSLKYGTLYEVTVSPDARDLSGNPLAGSYTWRFTTEPPPTASLAGILSIDNNSEVSYDAATRTAVLAMNALHPLEGMTVRAVQPSPDNNASVIAEDNTVAAASGAFLFPVLSPGKQLIVAEKSFPAGPVRRVIGVSFFYGAGDPPLRYVPLKDVTPAPDIVRLDEYCLDCHPAIGNVTRAGQIIRCAHVSGVVPINACKPTGKYDEYGRVTCESCHSVHYPTGSQHFALGEYSVLCNQCH